MNTFEAKELLELMAMALVDRPDDVDVREVKDGDDVVLELRVDPTDVGKVIGKQGRTVRAMRILIECASEKHGTHHAVEVIEE